MGHGADHGGERGLCPQRPVPGVESGEIAGMGDSVYVEDHVVEDCLEETCEED